MQLARLASWVHKWLAFLVGVQVVFWVVSGLFFTLFPIEQIRSEHLVRAPQAVLAIDGAALGNLSLIHDAQNRAPTKVTLEQRANGPAAVAEFADGDPILFDAATLRQLSPLDRDAALRIARGHVTLTDAPVSAVLVSEHSAEYRGPLPAWRVQFAEGGLRVYVAANTGAVTARRSDLWRLYDTLWALHIMDWRDHENFHHPLIIAFTVITLLSVIAGIVLIPYRIRFRRARPRKVLAEPSA
ncbi:MAG: PepSY domain-containing protein [Hyphomonadaceae bacterium]|nr:PepSY domain-containing protein [Hyphomonadaceae bacterium]